MKKKFAIVITCILLVISMLPISAFAVNDNIVILCSSWVENKRVMSCHAWKKLFHHLLLLVYFADVETKAHQVARGTHRAKRAEPE